MVEQVLAPGALAVVETAGGERVRLPLRVLRVKHYGATQVTVLLRDDERQSERRGSMPNKVTAICPGTFDPVTVGHLDIIRRGACKFQSVVVGLIEEPQRKQTLFSVEERLEFLSEALADQPNVVVDHFNDAGGRLRPQVARDRHPQGSARHLGLRLRVRHGAAEQEDGAGNRNRVHDGVARALRS